LEVRSDVSHAMMQAVATYSVKISAPKGSVVPGLLEELGRWLAKQTHGSLGWFDSFGAFPIPKAWDKGNAERLQKSGFAFLDLPEGSLLALLQTGPNLPPAVVLLGSEGERRTVANSFEEFLSLWANGETELSELDDEEGAAGRKLLAKWLKDHKVKAPKAKEFDFQAWLDGDAAAAPRDTNVVVITRKPTATFAKLGPKAKKLVAMLGRRVDDPDVVAYVTKELGKKLPQSTSERSADVNVDAPKAGLELVCSHEVHNERYPPIQKTAKAFVPYLSLAWVNEKFGEPILGVPWKVATPDAVVEILGEPMEMRGLVVTDKKKTIPVWTFLLDEGAEIELEISFRKWLRVTIAVSSAALLEKYHRVTTGLFLGWAAENRLLDERALAVHGALLADVKKRKAQGTNLFDALGRGLWDSHLKNDDALRSFAYLWFNNLGGTWITADLKKVFGKRVGPHGHDEPKLDDDTWAAVDKASLVFRQRFGAFLE
jgi:hypothetical protein